MDSRYSPILAEEHEGSWVFKPRIIPCPGYHIHIPVLLPELRSEMNKLVSGTVSPYTLGEGEIHFFSKRAFDKLHVSQPPPMPLFKKARNAASELTFLIQQEVSPGSGNLSRRRKVSIIIENSSHSRIWIIVHPVNSIGYVSHKSFAVSISLDRHPHADPPPTW